MCFHGIFQNNFVIYYFKKGQLLNPKKIHAIVNMPILEINNRSKCLMAWHKFVGILLTFAFIMAHITNLMIKIEPFI
jgi:hypothetical protein